MWRGRVLRSVPPSRRRNEIAAIIGGKGCGKSTRTLADLKRAQGSRTVLLWDPEGWFPSKIGGRTYVEVRDVREWMHSSKRGSPPYAVRFVAAPVQDAHLLVAIAWALPGSLVVYDDASNLAPYGTGPEWIRDAVTTARHRAVSLWFVVHGTTLLDKTVLRNIDRMVIGKLPLARDRAALAAEFEDARIEKLGSARPGSFLTFTR